MRSMQWQLGILGTISAFAFGYTERKNSYIDFRTRCLRLSASNKVNQKQQKSNLSYGQHSYDVFGKIGTDHIKQKNLTKFSLTNVMLYHNSHFETDSNCTAILFHINFALND